MLHQAQGWSAPIGRYFIYYAASYHYFLSSGLWPISSPRSRGATHSSFSSLETESVNGFADEQIQIALCNGGHGRSLLSPWTRPALPARYSRPCDPRGSLHKCSRILRRAILSHIYRYCSTVYVYVRRDEVRGKTSSSHSDLQCRELRHAGQNELVTLLCTSILCGELVS